MMKRAMIAILSMMLLAAMTACSYFLPAEKKTKAPPLMKSEEVVMPSVTIRRGDLVILHDMDAFFVPEPTMLFSAELERSGVVSEIYFSVGEKVSEGDLVVELDSDLARDRIMAQEINYKKAKLSYEENQVLFEAGKTDRYAVEFSRLALESAANYLQDLKDDLENHYVYAPADGVIVNLYCSVGLNASGKVFDVSDIDSGILDVPIPTNVDKLTPAEMALMEKDVGDPMRVIFGGREYEAELLRDIGAYFMEFGFDPAFSHTHIKIHGVPDGIRFNKTVTLRNIIAEAIDAIVIPASAVYSAGLDPYTYILSGNEVEKRYLELGINDGFFYEVISGLEEGELILKVK
ncbi:MAG: hypothetical protein R6W99_05280 [Clostridia bacterium]